MPEKIMRATQKKMISYPVTSTEVGYQYCRSLVSLSGQPRVEKGHRAELNQVSSTSSSRVRWVLPHFSQRVGSSRLTLMWPQSSQVQAGIWWPHHSWREMHQSWTFSIQLV